MEIDFCKIFLITKFKHNPLPQALGLLARNIYIFFCGLGGGPGEVDYINGTIFSRARGIREEEDG